MKEALKMALEAAYLAGFNASGEGYNGEYPFGDKMQDPAENRVWKEDRDNYIKEALAQPEHEIVTLMNNLALIIAGDAMGYRELVWNLSGKVMAVAMSAEPVKGQAYIVQVTAEAMSNLRKFVEEEVTRRLAFHNKLFDVHTSAAWKLNTNPPQRKE